MKPLLDKAVRDEALRHLTMMLSRLASGADPLVSIDVEKFGETFTCSCDQQVTTVKTTFAFLLHHDGTPESDQLLQMIEGVEIIRMLMAVMGDEKDITPEALLGAMKDLLEEEDDDEQ